MCVLMAGAGTTALRISMTATQQHVAMAPHASTALHLLSVSAPMERQVGLKEQTICRYVENIPYFKEMFTAEFISFPFLAPDRPAVPLR